MKEIPRMPPSDATKSTVHAIISFIWQALRGSAGG